jgi:hypothetical protein
MKTTAISAARSTGAVLAGLVAIVALSHGTDAALRAAGALPPWGVPLSAAAFAAALAYRTLFGSFGCYLTARLAPSRPERHSFVLGGIGVIASLAGAITTWNLGPEFGPHWYPLALVASALPNAWLGAWLNSPRSRRAAAARCNTTVIPRAG